MKNKTKNKTKTYVKLNKNNEITMNITTNDPNFNKNNNYLESSKVEQKDIGRRFINGKSIEKEV